MRYSQTGNPNKPTWEMSFYLSERTRKTGIACLKRLIRFQHGYPVLKFELTLSEIRERGKLIPLIYKEENKVFEDVVNPEWRHKGKSPSWRTN